ncbi:MAG TPA: fumarylacetoacetate hydrolase family protein [Granulicella sp.]|jgi:2-keto-4-pentenoate hydratase/2-oxohepta-3-ene-1,7-dioic acid hydratase in catechol pathway|nr:fumarylacetoacetate hydrolase family protein [Granulicella sp.]
MKFISFSSNNGAVRGGVLEGDRVRPLTQTGADPVLAHIQSGRPHPELDGSSLLLDDVRLLAPLRHPPRIFGIGLNYREHAAESKMVVQSVPTVFLKLASSITGPDSDVLLPPEATQPDYEAELAVVIGKPGHHIAVEDWEQHVFGYTIVNDVSARGVQLATSQWTLGKSFPTFTPLGPAVVTRDEVPDPHALDIRLSLGEEIMQSANTSDLIFRIPQLIAHLSSIVGLEAGDIISTGTPPGVGLGRTPPRWLQPGEEMVIEIERIGTLRNHTRATT